MRTQTKLSDLSARVKKPLNWTINFVQKNFPDSITFVEDSTIKGGGIYLVDDREFNIICNAILTSDSMERGSLREQREINEKLAEDSLSEDEEEDTVQTVSEYSRSNEVLLLADAAEALGISKEAFTLAVRRAQANGVQLPAITIINSGNRGRPKYGYSNDFVDTIKKFIELPKTSSLFGVNSAYEPIAIGKSPYKTLVSNEFASKRLLGKFDENLQTLFDILQGSGEYGIAKDELANKLDISPKSLNAMLADLQNRGYNLAVTGETAMLETSFTADYTAKKIEWGTNGTYKVGIVSDLHACCEYTKIKSIQSAYEQFAKQGVSIVFNAGDTTHGHVDMHGAYKYEIKLRTLENQLNHLVQDYPKIDGIQTFMIAGNHDLSWGRQGVDFIKLLSDRREDITYLGPTVAFVDGPEGIPNFAMLYHPKDGSSYALSYRTQKIAEYVTYSLKGLTDDPDIPQIMPQIAMIGHYHKYVHHKGPDSAHYITCPALCGMTDFQKGKHLINEMGALMFEFGLSDKGKIDYWSIKGFDVAVGREVLYVEEQYSSPKVAISGFWNKDTNGGKI